MDTSLNKERQALTRNPETLDNQNQQIECRPHGKGPKSPSGYLGAAIEHDGVFFLPS
jgi:hypothetical protein